MRAYDIHMVRNGAKIWCVLSQHLACYSSDGVQSCCFLSLFPCPWLVPDTHSDGWVGLIGHIAAVFAINLGLSQLHRLTFSKSRISTPGAKIPWKVKMAYKNKELITAYKRKDWAWFTTRHCTITFNKVCSIPNLGRGSGCRHANEEVDLGGEMTWDKAEISSLDSYL